MAIDHKARVQTIVVGPETTLTEVLDEVTDTPVVVERNGDHFRIVRDPRASATPSDPEAFSEALRRSAGAFAGIDKEAYRRDLRFWRDQEDDHEAE